MNDATKQDTTTHTFTPTPGLKQGDVGVGDLVRFVVNGNQRIQGRVAETAAEGGVVGVRVGGRTYSCALPHLQLLAKATAVDVLEQRLDRLTHEVRRVEAMLEVAQAMIEDQRERCENR